MSVSYSAYQPSGQLGSKLEHVIITFQKNEIPLFRRVVEVAGWLSGVLAIPVLGKATGQSFGTAMQIPQRSGASGCWRQEAPVLLCSAWCSSAFFSDTPLRCSRSFFQTSGSDSGCWKSRIPYRCQEGLSLSATRAGAHGQTVCCSDIPETRCPAFCG